MRRAIQQENKRKKENVKKAKLTNKKNTNFSITLDKKKTMILVGCIIVFAFVIAINNYTSLGLVLNKNISTEDAVQVELQSSNNKIIPFGNEILVYNSGTITSYNNCGKQTAKIKLEDTLEADVMTAGNYIQVINKDKSLVYIYKNKYEVARIKIAGEVYSGYINSEGTSVIEYSANGNKTEFGIYDNSGKKTYNVKLSNNIVGKYVLSEDSKYLAYVDVNIRGISAQTNINVINLSNIKEDESNAKTIYTKDNSLAYDIYWFNKNIIIRFEENYVIYNVSSDKKEVIDIDAGQLVNISDYDKRYASINIDGTGNYLLNIKKMKSDRLKTVAIDDVPKYFKYEDGIVYVCYAKKIEAYNNFGMKIKTYDSKTVITDPIVFNRGRSMVFAISNKLIMFTI